MGYLRALRIRRLCGRVLDGLLAPFAAIVAPTLRRLAPPITGAFSALFEDHGPALRAAGNLCGLPAVTVPNGFGDGGLPTGLEFMGRAYSEARIREVARAYQARTDLHTGLPLQG